MKHLLIALFFAGSALAQEFNIDPTPQINDRTEAHSLKRINKILNDARRGTNPLSTTGGGGALSAGESVVGSTFATIANPPSVLTRVADTNAYATNDLIATSTTAGSVVVPSFTAARVAAGGGIMRRFRLYTNKTSGWDAVSLEIEFWTAAPTFTNGDNGAYAVATGAATHLGTANFTLKQVADGAYGIGTPVTGSEIMFKLASGQSIFWTLKYTGAAALTPASAQTFTLVPEIVY